MKYIKEKYSRRLKDTFGNENHGDVEPDLRPTTRILWIIIFICCFLMAGGIVAGIFWGRDIFFLTSTEDVAASKNEGWRLPLLMFFGGLILYGWGTIIAFGGFCSLQMKESTEGRIINSELRSDYDDGGYNYRIYSMVSYSVNGFQYERQGMHFYFTQDKKEAEKKLESFKTKNKITVIYDPKNPNLMTLDSKNNASYNEILGGIGFIIGGTLLAIRIGLVLS